MQNECSFPKVISAFSSSMKAFSSFGLILVSRYLSLAVVVAFVYEVDSS